jgi:hypothetical protein
VDAIWNYEGTDFYTASFRGTRAIVELKDGEVYVVPRGRKDAGALEALGFAVEDEGARFRVVIPPGRRIGHEAHFARLLSTFLDYVKNPALMPAWEAPNMLAKYYVSTVKP